MTVYIRYCGMFLSFADCLPTERQCTDDENVGLLVQLPIHRFIERVKNTIKVTRIEEKS